MLFGRHFVGRCDSDGIRSREIEGEIEAYLAEPRSQVRYQMRSADKGEGLGRGRGTLGEREMWMDEKSEEEVGGA